MHTVTTVLEDWRDGDGGIYKLQQLYIYWDSNIRAQVQFVYLCAEAPLWMEEKSYQQAENTRNLPNYQLIWLTSGIN